MTRIQGPKMGFADFQKPVLQTPHLSGFMDFKIPSLPKIDFPIDAGSAPAGGGTGAGAAPPSAPLPTPAPAPAGYPGYQPAYLFPVQEVPVPAPAAAPPVQVTVAGSPVVPTWAIVGGALLAGIVLAKLL